MSLNLFGFLQEARQEAKRVTWPTRRETMITTLMVFAMILVASVFFVLSDQVIQYILGLLLGTR